MITMDKPMVAVLVVNLVFWGSIGGYIAYDSSITPEEREAARVEEVSKRVEYETRAYKRAYESCMTKRPMSNQRADCLWDAGQEYPQGRLNHLRTLLLEQAQAAGYDVEIVTKAP